MLKDQVITVETFLDDELEMERTVNLRNKEARDRFRRHMFWPMLNGRMVQAIPQEEGVHHA